MSDTMDIFNEATEVVNTRTAVEKFDAKYYEINLLKAEINRQVGEIMAEVAGLVHEVENGPLAEDVKALKDELAKLRPAMEAEVIATGKTVKAEHVQLVYTPPGYKWDTKNCWMAWQRSSRRSPRPAATSRPV